MVVFDHLVGVRLSVTEQAIGFPGNAGLASGTGAARGQASDAEIAKTVRAAMIRAGISRDPSPEFAKLHPDRDRERWGRAMAAMDRARGPGSGQLAELPALPERSQQGAGR